MKKFVSYIFIIIFILSIGIIGAKAESMGVYLEKGDSKSNIKAGDIITVNYIIEPSIYLEEGMEVMSTDISVYYDADIFEIVKNGDKDYHYTALPLSGSSGVYFSKRANVSLQQRVNEPLYLQPGERKLLAVFKFKVKDGVASQSAVIYNNDKDEIFCNFTEYGETRIDICAYGTGNELSYTIEDVNNTPQEENNVAKPQTVTTTKATTTQAATTTTESVTEETITTEPTTVTTTKSVEKEEIKLEEKESTGILTMILCGIGGAVAAVVAILSILSLKKNKNNAVETLDEGKEETAYEKTNKK